MIKLNMEQGTDEWFQARLGIPTASEFDKIVTTTGKASTQAKSYMGTLLGEWLTGKSDNDYINEWMTRGNELEPEARDTYEFITGREVKQIGFVYKDKNRIVGCSPDGFMRDRGLEIKCPKLSTHIFYLIEGKIPTKYIAQVQGSMWVTGKKKWDFMSYHPDLEPLIVTVLRDDNYIRTLEAEIDKFIIKMLELRNKLKQYKK